MKRFCLLLALFLLAFDPIFGCKSEPSQELFEDYDDEDEIDQSHVDDDLDETQDDVSLDTEDFDLMCSLFEEPDRIKRKPDFIIFGAKKGGTRALIEFLKLHPDIKAAGPEIHFFDVQQNYEKGLDWYINQMPAVAEGQLATEKTPGYFHTRDVPKRIKAMDPEIKLLLILRDPVKRLVSDYNQFRTKNLDKGDSYPELEEMVFDASGEINLKYPPLGRSLYHKHMKRWLKHFPRDQIHIVDGDNFIKAPWEETEKVENFLQIPHAINRDSFFFNGTKGYYCGRDVREKGVWTCKKDKCLSKTKGRPKPPLKTGTEKKLTEFFRSYNALFYQLVNQTFSWPI